MKVAMVRPMSSPVRIGGVTYDQIEAAMDRLFQCPETPQTAPQGNGHPDKGNAPTRDATTPVQPRGPVKIVNSQNAIWAEIVRRARGDEPVLIDEFLQTPLGQRLYAAYRRAPK